MIKTVLLHAKQAQRGGRGTAVTILNPGTTEGWSVPHPDCFTPGRERYLVLIVQKAGWALRLVWVGMEGLAVDFEPQTIQPVLCCCKNYAITPTNLSVTNN